MLSPAHFFLFFIKIKNAMRHAQLDSVKCQHRLLLNLKFCFVLFSFIDTSDEYQIYHSFDFRQHILKKIPRLRSTPKLIIIYSFHFSSSNCHRCISICTYIVFLSLLFTLYIKNVRCICLASQICDTQCLFFFLFI